MYFITNREINTSKHGYDKFTKHPNAKGPNELQAVEITGVGSPTFKLLKDQLSVTEIKRLKKKFSLDIDEHSPHYASLTVACHVFEQARKQCKNVLLYVHGYNNDIKDVYSTAREIERAYDVIVVTFTWPANSGGALSGTLSYLADKRDARASQDALNRCIDLAGKYHALLTMAARNKLEERASQKFIDNPTKQREYLAQLIKKDCDLSVSLLCHSMGNYVFKHALTSSLSEARKLIFDNIILVAADTNNEAHRAWVEKLQVRNAIYITINENDYALSWSRRKPGEQQKARLGHYLKKLDANNATYIDFTREKAVNNSHSYFDKKTTATNKGALRFFKKVFSGEDVTPYLEYISHNNTYRPK
ncbi:MAG: alpha/beta hydrolase [Gammaproteobacteria bacterium]